jgi:Lamin Tail Domain
MVLPVLIALFQPASAQPGSPAVMPPAASPSAGNAAKHPIITEILYAVPKEGDADQDGKRSATGDEFIELVNAGDRPIQMKGYTLSDGKSPAQAETPAKTEPKAGGKGKGDPKDKGKTPAAERRATQEARVRFTFPELTLQPGEVVVVFNGYESHTPGPVGDAKAAGKNEKFGGAYVFSMHVTSQYTALANAGDCVLLTDPEGNGVECVTWGESDKKPEKSAAVTHKAPESRGSVQRAGVSGEFVQHQELPAPYGGTPWSPGKFELKK